MGPKICGKRLHVKWIQASGDVLGGVPQRLCANRSETGIPRNSRGDGELIALLSARCVWLLGGSRRTTSARSSRSSSDQGGAHVLKRLLRGRASTSTGWLRLRSARGAPGNCASSTAVALGSGFGRFRTALRLPCSGLASLGLLVVLVTVTLLVSWWAGALAAPWEDPNGDVLIGLGESLLEDGRAGLARRVLSRGLSRVRGVPRTAIEIADQSRSTHENALYVAELLDGVSGRKVQLPGDRCSEHREGADPYEGIGMVGNPLPSTTQRQSRPAHCQ